jgi:NADH:ubiquinone reductase (H+-translocating)
MFIMEYVGVSLMEKRLKTAVVREEESGSEKTGAVPHMVIVGAGFGGLRAARALRYAPVQMTVIDRSNHHQFQPFPYQVATADLSPADIAAPIRSMLKHQKNTTVILAEATGVDVQGQRALMHERRYVAQVIAQRVAGKKGGPDFPLSLSREPGHCGAFLCGG